jgi:hypothetical protein
MKKKSVILPYLAIFCFFLLVNMGCEPPNKPEKRHEKEIDLTNIKRIEIPVGDSFSGGEASLTRNFYFIFDGSGSMDHAPGGECKGDQNFQSKIEGARWAVREFMKKVPDDINLGLYVFDSHFGRREVIPIGTVNHQKFLTSINQIKAGGLTPLAEAIRIGTNQLVGQYKKQLGYGEYRLIIVTDGIADGIPEAVLYAAQYGIPIYSIGLCIGNEHPLRQFAFSYRAADSFADLAKGLEETLAELDVFDPTEFE